MSWNESVASEDKILTGLDLAQDEILAKTVGIVERYTEAILSDPRRFKALLLDICFNHRKEINVLVAALEEQVVVDLRTSSVGIPVEVTLARLTQRLVDIRAINEAMARWAVETLAQALNISVPKLPVPISLPIVSSALDLSLLLPLLHPMAEAVGNGYYPDRFWLTKLLGTNHHTELEGILETLTKWCIVLIKARGNAVLESCIAVEDTLQSYGISEAQARLAVQTVTQIPQQLPDPKSLLVNSLVVAPDNTGDSDCNTVSSAIQIAQTADDICIRTGRYFETLKLNSKSNISLTGKGIDIVELIGERSSPVLIIVNCQNIHIEGISFRHTGTSNAHHPIIKIQDSENIEIVTCLTAGSTGSAGIEIINSAHIVIRECHSLYNRMGVYAHSKSSGKIERCLCEKNTGYGVYLEHPGASWLLEDNQCCENNVAGIFYEGPGRMVQLFGNQCQHNEFGFRIKCSRNEQSALMFRNNVYIPNRKKGIDWVGV
jgi:hypothetical protein